MTGVAEITLVDVTGKVCEVAPDPTITLAGTVRAAFELASVTITPPFGAADVSVTVPVPACPPTTVLGLTETVLSAAAGAGGAIVSANILLTLASEAVSVTGVEVVTAPLVTVNVAVVDPCGITTLAGTLAAVVAELERNTVKPPKPAAEVDVTVPVPDCPLTIELGLTEKVLRAGGGFTVIPNVTLVPE